MTHPRRRGFTLIELVLASGITALLMLSLYTALHAAFKARLGMTVRATNIRAARVALDLVEQNLRSILPPTGTLAGPFYGTAGEITCYTLGRDYGNDADPQADGMRLVDVLLDSTGPAPTLVQKVTRNLLSSSAVTPATEILATNVTAFSVRYYDGTTWADSWDSVNTQTGILPLVVEVKITVQPITGEPPYTISRMIALPCGTAETAAGTT